MGFLFCRLYESLNGIFLYGNEPPNSGTHLLRGANKTPLLLSTLDDISIHLLKENTISGIFSQRSRSFEVIVTFYRHSMAAWIPTVTVYFLFLLAFPIVTVSLLFHLTGPHHH
jgi:hypothetical protein